METTPAEERAAVLRRLGEIERLIGKYLKNPNSREPGELGTLVKERTKLEKQLGKLTG